MAKVKVVKRQCDATNAQYDDKAPGSALVKVTIFDGNGEVGEFRNIDLSPDAVSALPTGKSRVLSEDQKKKRRETAEKAEAKRKAKAAAQK